MLNITLGNVRLMFKQIVQFICAVFSIIYFPHRSSSSCFYYGVRVLDKALSGIDNSVVSMCVIG